MSKNILEMIQDLRRFVGPAQLGVMVANTRGEEGQFFRDMIRDLHHLTETMPKTYEQDGKGLEAVAHLHYFTGGADWYITERDMEPVQHQAFGLADLYGDGGELGYISIVELIQNGVELDLYGTPDPRGDQGQDGSGGNMTMTTSEYMERVRTETARIVSLMHEKATLQAEYDATNNLPKGIIAALDDRLAEMRAREAAIQAIATHIEWDLSDAKDLAVHLLEDVNYHDAAEMLDAYDD